MTFQEFDIIRKDVSSRLNATRRSEWGQFMTPGPIAEFMAKLFNKKWRAEILLLEAGAGIGSLIGSFYKRWINKEVSSTNLKIFAFERDSDLCEILKGNLEVIFGGRMNKSCTSSIYNKDFIPEAIDMIKSGSSNFTHAILNPPYKKINSDSQHRQLLNSVGLETVNLYSAFVGLSLKLLDKNGELVAIIPRSFCNGPYYKTFRKFILSESSVQHIHLFNSRSDAFREDEVLQENIIIHLVKGKKQGRVSISTSADNSFSDYNVNKFSFDRIVDPNDKELFIHIPEGNIARTQSDGIEYSLHEIGLQVSTGPVVDFRLKEFLRKNPSDKTVPLLYPVHFSGLQTQWPIDSKKPNAICRTYETEKWLYPNGYYVVVRRFSSKEEKRRIVASVFTPDVAKNIEVIGFENHLNIFHCNKKGLSREIAYGLAVYLNSTMVDKYFRQFNGHTQVNATDLKNIKYPPIETLHMLGVYAIDRNLDLSQEAFDSLLTIVTNDTKIETAATSH